MTGIDGDATTSWGVITGPFDLSRSFPTCLTQKHTLTFIDWCSLLKLSLNKHPWDHNEFDCCPHCHLLGAVS